MAVTKLRCPKCETILKIGKVSEKAKAVRCPKCGAAVPLRPAKPGAPAAKPPAPAGQKAPAAKRPAAKAPRPEPAAAPVKKKAKKKRPQPQSKAKLWIGLGTVGAVILGVVLFLLLRPGTPPPPPPAPPAEQTLDLTKAKAADFLPPDWEWVAAGVFRAAAILNSPLLQQLPPTAKQQYDGMTAMVQLQLGFSPKQLEEALVVTDGDLRIGLATFTEPVDTAKVVQRAQPLEKYKGIQIYRDPSVGGQSGGYSVVAHPRLVVSFSQLEAMKAALERAAKGGGKPLDLPADRQVVLQVRNFAKVSAMAAASPLGRMAGAMPPSGPGAAPAPSSPGAPPSPGQPSPPPAASPMEEWTRDLTGASFTMNLTDGLDLQLSAEANSEEAAKELAEKLGGLKTMAGGLIAMQKLSGAIKAGSSEDEAITKALANEFAVEGKKVSFALAVDGKTLQSLGGMIPTAGAAPPPASGPPSPGLPAAGAPSPGFPSPGMPGMPAAESLAAPKAAQPAGKAAPEAKKTPPAPKAP